MSISSRTSRLNKFALIQCSFSSEASAQNSWKDSVGFEESHKFLETNNGMTRTHPDIRRKLINIRIYRLAHATIGTCLDLSKMGRNSWNVFFSTWFELCRMRLAKLLDASIKISFTLCINYSKNLCLYRSEKSVIVK